MKFMCEDTKELMPQPYERLGECITIYPHLILGWREEGKLWYSFCISLTFIPVFFILELSSELAELFSLASYKSGL